MATGTVPITAGTGTDIRVITNPTVDGGARQQVTSLGAPDGTLAPFDPDGTLQVAQDSKALFFDSFDTTLANFTTGGTAPTISAGAAAFASSTTASASSYLRSTLGFTLRPQAFLRAGAFVQLDAAAITNSARWWGYGQNQATPTGAAPVLNGAVFMLDPSAGALIGAIYSAGTRTQSVTLPRPADGALHKYEVWFRQSVVFFLMDGATVGSISLPNTAVTSGMYLIAGSANGTTAPGSAPTLHLSSFSMADTSGTVNTLGDGINPTTQATVRAPAAVNPTTADTMLVVQSIPVPSLNATTLGAAATAVTLTLAAPGAGLRHYITGVWMERYISVATTGAATQINSTATNSTIVFSLPFDTQAVGVVNFPVAITFLSPVATTAQNTATTFTVPAVTGTIYRISVSYFIAP